MKACYLDLQVYIVLYVFLERNDHRLKLWSFIPSKKPFRIKAFSHFKSSLKFRLCKQHFTMHNSSVHKQWFQPAGPSWWIRKKTVYIPGTHKVHYAERIVSKLSCKFTFFITYQSKEALKDIEYATSCVPFSLVERNYYLVNFEGELWVGQLIKLT